VHSEMDVVLRGQHVGEAMRGGIGMTAMVGEGGPYVEDSQGLERAGVGRTDYCTSGNTVR
jgi:hypothetical protein